MTPDRIRVLESFPEPKATTNPYITQLATSLGSTPGVELSTFHIRTALLGRYDVFHVHWPENLIGGHRRVGRIARRLATAAFLARLQLARTPVVRTWHNLDRPTGLGRTDTALLDWLDALTTIRIRLNELTDPGGLPVATILHGHYRDWFADFPRSDPRPGRLVYAGLVRPYKGVEDLVSAFVRTADPGLSLNVTGRPADAAHAARLHELAQDDERVSFDLRYVDEADLVRVLTSAALVVLPYRYLHNSGAVLAALSLDRPVLVPDGDVARKLAAEVGESWVLRFEGPITPGVIRDAAARAATVDHTTPPDLSRRGWQDAGRAHREAFREALRLGAPSRGARREHASSR
jgi:glycosyltransferase involved in cell wall biosynthesis